MQKATTTPSWMAENFKPKGNRGAVSKALRLALGAAGKPIQNRSATGATSFEPEISTNKSSANAVLPLVADGSRLSWPGALEAIDRAARAFNLEGLLQHQASKPDEVKRQLEDIGNQARRLAASLISLSDEARWRLASLPSEELWPEEHPGFGIRLPNAFKMKPNDAEEFYEHITDQDRQFLHLRIGELIPYLSGIDPRDSCWNQSLSGLATMLRNGANAPSGPREKRGARDRENEYEVIGGFPAFLLIRECDAILCAAMSIQSEANWIGSKGHSFHMHLKPFAKAVFDYATGQDPISVLDRPFRAYSDSMGSHQEAHPHSWRAYRISALKLQDFQDHCDPTIFDQGMNHAIEATLVRDVSRLVRLAKKQMKTKADYLERHRELAGILTRLRMDRISEEPETESVQEWVYLMEREQHEMLVLAGEVAPESEDDISLISRRTPSRRTLPQGPTFLSGLN